MDETIPYCGVPEALLSDRGTNLLSHLMCDVCKQILLPITLLSAWWTYTTEISRLLWESTQHNGTNRYWVLYGSIKIPKQVNSWETIWPSPWIQLHGLYLSSFTNIEPTDAMDNMKSWLFHFPLQEDYLLRQFARPRGSIWETTTSRLFPVIIVFASGRCEVPSWQDWQDAKAF